MENQKTDLTPAQIFDVIGRDEARERLYGPSDEPKPKGEKAIAQALWKRELPSAWYAVVKNMCDEKQIECPKSFFTFRKDEHVKEDREVAS